MVLLAALLISCTNRSVKSEVVFQLNKNSQLVEKDWSLSGRLALADRDNSFSASLVWSHHKEWEKIELSGPFGQGRVLITINDEHVIIDRGNKPLHYFGDVDEVVSGQLGVFVPVLALKYWLLGVVEPKVAYQKLKDGFIQSNWRVRYSQMQVSGGKELPRKMKLDYENVRLKLIVDEWNIE